MWTRRCFCVCLVLFVLLFFFREEVFSEELKAFEVQHREGAVNASSFLWYIVSVIVVVFGIGLLLYVIFYEPPFASTPSLNTKPLEHGDGFSRYQNSSRSDKGSSDSDW